jgi:hypothetical protein
MRKRFDKSPAIDAASNLRLVTMIQNHDELYTVREEEILEDGRNMLDMFEQQKSKELEMTSRTTQAKMAFKDGQSHAYGWSTAVVRASPAQVLAYIWDTNKRAGVYADTLEQTLDEDGEHNKLVYVRGGSARQSLYPPSYPSLHAGTSRRRCATRSTTGTFFRDACGGNEPQGTSSSASLSSATPTRSPPTSFGPGSRAC